MRKHKKKREEKKAVGCCAHIIVDWDFIEMAFLRANETPICAVKRNFRRKKTKKRLWMAFEESDGKISLPWDC